MLFKEPGKAQKKSPQEHQDLELQKEQPGKGQGQKTQEEGSRKLKNPRVSSKKIITDKKSDDSGKGRKQPYSVLEHKDQSTQKERYGKSWQHLQCGHNGRSEPHRDHPPFSDISKIKGGMSCIFMNHKQLREIKNHLQRFSLPRERRGVMRRNL